MRGGGHVSGAGVGSDVCSNSCGGRGSRLGALTRSRCKPALPFGGGYRSIDFVLSNCVNSRITRIGIAAQYQAQSLIRHVQQSWSVLQHERGGLLEFWTAGQREGACSYAGTADAVFQNLTAVNRHRPQYVIVLAADRLPDGLFSHAVVSPQ